MSSRTRKLGLLKKALVDDRAHALSHVVDLVLGAEPAPAIEGELAAPRPKPGTGRVRAGVGKREITPPPGWPTAGHSIEARIARGVWTRLFTRAVYLEDGGGAGLVLCVSDLWAITASLVDEVTERVQSHAACAHLGRSQILLSATHTHHGQGNFASSRVYNDHTTSRPGHDPAMREFLVEQIANAIITAVEGAEPARLTLGHGRVGGVVRNRAPASFVKNPEAEAFLESHLDVPPPEERYGRPDVAFRAVDDRLRVLRMERDDGSLIGVSAFFTGHNTAMPNHAPLYHADYFGIATTLVEKRLAARAPSSSSAPMVALYNGAEGDVSPNWAYQGVESALALGQRLADAISELERKTAEDGEPVDGTVASRSERVPLFGQSFVDERGVEHRTARFPMAGASQFGGAEDGRTVLYVLGWKPGIRALAPDPDQGAKRPALLHPRLGRGMRLTRSLLPHDHVPEHIPVQVARFGPLVFGTLPGEFTTTMGRRVSTRVAARVGTSLDHTFMLGLAGEYLGYFTTPEEYEAQDYEGASMMFGPFAGEYLASRFAALATGVGDGVEMRAERFCHQPGTLGVFPKEMPPLDATGRRSALARQLAVIDPSKEFERWPYFDYRAPRRSLSSGDGHLMPAGARIRVEVSYGDGAWEPYFAHGAPVDDEGIFLLALLLCRDHDHDVWRVHYLGPRPPAEEAKLRFSVEIDGRQSQRSPAF